MRIQPRFIGVVKLTKREYDPTLVETPGEVVEERVIYNKEMNFMLNACAKWLSGASTAVVIPPTQIGAGNGSPPYGQTGPQATDTALWSPIATTQRQCDSIMVSQGYYAQYNLTYQTTDPAGYYNELGLFDANNNLWAHVMINNYKSSTQTLTAQWMIYMVADTSNGNAVITNYMRTAFAKWLTGSSNVSGQTGAVVPPTQIQLGTGTGSVMASDSALWMPAANTQKNCDTISIISSTNVMFAKTYLAADPTGNFTEAGIVDTSGNLWVHATFPSNSGNKTGSNQMSVVGQVGLVGN